MKKLFVLAIGVGMLFASNFSQGVRAFKQGDLQKAQKYFEAALQEDGIANAGYFLGVIYLERKDKSNYEKARKYLSIAQKIGNKRAGCYLAKLYLLQKKDEDKAKKLLEEGSKNGARECQMIAKEFNISIKG